MCVSFWTRGHKDRLRIEYVQELLSYQNSKYISAFVSGFVRNLDTEPRSLHVVHRRHIVMEDLTSDWLDLNNDVTRLFLQLYEYVINPSQHLIPVDPARIGRSSPCNGELVRVMPPESKILLNAALTSDFPEPPPEEAPFVPYSSYEFGPIPPDPDRAWAFRLGFRIQGPTYHELVATTKHERRHEIQGAEILLKDIEVFDFGAIPESVRPEFKEYRAMFCSVLEQRVPAVVYDVVAKECSEGAKVVRYDSLVRKLPVPKTVSEEHDLQWWRSEGEGFLIQLVEPKT